MDLFFLEPLIILSGILIAFDANIFGLLEFSTTSSKGYVSIFVGLCFILYAFYHLRQKRKKFSTFNQQPQLFHISEEGKYKLRFSLLGMVLIIGLVDIIRGICLFL